MDDERKHFASTRSVAAASDFGDDRKLAADRSPRRGIRCCAAPIRIFIRCRRRVPLPATRLFLTSSALLAVTAAAAVVAVYCGCGLLGAAGPADDDGDDASSTFWPFNYTSDSDGVGDAALVDFLVRWILVPPPEARSGAAAVPEGAPSKPPSWDPSAEGIMSGLVVPKYLSTIVKGTFFEAGVLDGETLSNTWYLEKKLGWTGLLGEMNPWNVRKVLRRNRGAWFAPVCLSPVPRPIRVRMNVMYNSRRPHSTWGSTISSKKWAKNLAIAGTLVDPPPRYSTVVDCFPLQTMLLATNISRIDFFSLDVEGVELQVLKSLWWDKLDVKVMLLDLLHTEEGAESVRAFLEEMGFVLVYGSSDQVVFVSKRHLSTLTS